MESLELWNSSIQKRIRT